MFRGLLITVRGERLTNSLRKPLPLHAFVLKMGFAHFMQMSWFKSTRRRAERRLVEHLHIQVVSVILLHMIASYLSFCMPLERASWPTILISLFQPQTWKVLALLRQRHHHSSAPVHRPSPNRLQLHVRSCSHTTVLSLHFPQSKSVD